MIRQFLMSTVLRRTPFKMLRWFLPDVGIELGFDWEKLRTSDLPKVIAAYNLVPAEQRHKAEETVREIMTLADREGLAALKEAAKINGLTHWDIIFKGYASVYLHAIWAWTAHRTVFEQAKKILRTNRSAYFRKRSGLPTGQPPLIDDTLTVLKEELQRFFLDKQGRGKVCTIETVDRGGGQWSVFAYPDDKEKPLLQHDEQKVLTPLMTRPVFEIIFNIDADTGTLAVSAKLGKAVREELENLFIRTVYRIEPPLIAKPQYVIEQLKNPHFRLITEPSDAVRVEVSSLKLKWKNIQSLSVLTADKEGSVFRTVSGLLKEEKRNLNDAEVRQAAIRFRFHKKQGRRAGMLCAELTPTNLMLRCKDTVRIEIIHKYLKQWGLIK